jgi:hypothetical protein
MWIEDSPNTVAHRLMEVGWKGEWEELPRSRHVADSGNYVDDIDPFFLSLDGADSFKLGQ